MQQVSAQYTKILTKQSTFDKNTIECNVAGFEPAPLGNHPSALTTKRLVQHHNHHHKKAIANLI